MNTTAKRDPLLRMILADVRTDAPAQITNSYGIVAPISAAAASSLAERLQTVAAMHETDQLTDAQLVAAVNRILEACADTSALHHRLTPEQREATMQRVIDELAEKIGARDTGAQA